LRGSESFFASASGFLFWFVQFRGFFLCPFRPFLFLILSLPSFESFPIFTLFSDFFDFDSVVSFPFRFSFCCFPFFVFCFCILFFFLFCFVLSLLFVFFCFLFCSFSIFHPFPPTYPFSLFFFPQHPLPLRWEWVLGKKERETNGLRGGGEGAGNGLSNERVLQL
jgi:hypothetical protein